MRRVLIGAGLVVLMSGVALAQFGLPRGRMFVMKNIEYDGRFTFVRLNYTTAPGGYFYRGEPAWAHGYPIAEQNLMRIMNEVSFLGAHTEEINTLTLDDPELFKYPVAYVIEPDWWAMTDSEAKALHEYLQRGGFLIVDDFKGRNFRGGGGWADRVACAEIRDAGTRAAAVGRCSGCDGGRDRDSRPRHANGALCRAPVRAIAGHRDHQG